MFLVGLNRILGRLTGFWLFWGGGGGGVGWFGWFGWIRIRYFTRGDRCFGHLPVVGCLPDEDVCQILG